MKKKEIKIPIAGRVYSISSSHDDDEQKVETLSKQIEQMLFNFENTYQIKDKQDSLAMCVLQLLIKLDKLEKTQDGENTEILKRLDELEKMVQSVK